MLRDLLNWLARRAEPSAARRAIVIANAAGFGCAAAMDIWGVVSGDARPIAKLFLVVHWTMALAFSVAARRERARAL